MSMQCRRCHKTLDEGDVANIVKRPALAAAAYRLSDEVFTAEIVGDCCLDAHETGFSTISHAEAVGRRTLYGDGEWPSLTKKQGAVLEGTNFGRVYRAKGNVYLFDPFTERDIDVSNAARSLIGAPLKLCQWHELGRETRGYGGTTARLEFTERGRALYDYIMSVQPVAG